MLRLRVELSFRYQSGGHLRLRPSCVAQLKQQRLQKNRIDLRRKNHPSWAESVQSINHPNLFSFSSSLRLAVFSIWPGPVFKDSCSPWCRGPAGQAPVSFALKALLILGCRTTGREVKGKRRGDWEERSDGKCSHVDNRFHLPISLCWTVDPQEREGGRERESSLC